MEEHRLNQFQSPTLRWSGLSDVGRFRKNNEDAFLALTFDARELKYLGKVGEADFSMGDFLFAVSDGMGGAKSGEFASKIAVEHITKLLPKSFHLSAQRIDAGLTDVLKELFSRIHETMTQMGRYYEECAGMGATLSLCWVMPEWIYFGHIGDSRIYFLPKEGPMIQVSEDHSYVGWLQRQGKLNEREARMHPQRHALNQVLGGGNRNIEPQVGRIAWENGDRLLLCSDGLIDGLWDRRIEDIARRDAPDGVLSTIDLVREAVSDSGRDNTTAILLELGDTAESD
ncbi:MAG: PP2C family protein-serine/threonine phosphatase [Akkermansiaceae bacterium]